MGEPTEPISEGPFDAVLTERLDALRAELPNRPLPYYRMLLIKGLHEELSLPPREAMRVVDAYYSARGLGIRQPTVLQAILFGIAASLVLVVPMLLIYWLWLQLRPR